MRFVISLVAALCATSAFAQDGSEQTATRTIEGANQFLGEFLPTSGGMMQMSIFAPNLYRSSGMKKWIGWRFITPLDTYNTNWVGVRSRVVRVSYSDKCVTVFNLTDFLHGGDGPYADPTTSIAPQGEVRDLSMDWRAVEFIHLYDAELPSVLTITRKDNKVGPYFTFPNASAAKRVKFAMDFLRAACVPTSTTGF